MLGGTLVFSPGGRGRSMEATEQDHGITYHVFW